MINPDELLVIRDLRKHLDVCKHATERVIDGPTNTAFAQCNILFERIINAVASIEYRIQQVPLPR